MQKLFLSISFVLLFFLAGCNEESYFLSPESGKVTLHLRQTWILDADNLASEQIIRNITVLLTEPSSDVITHKYVEAGFSHASEYESVSLPDDPSTLNRKDIYVITNYDNAADFESIASLQELNEILTPAVSATNNLHPENGICMFGKTLDFDFNNEAQDPAVVYAERTCAKYRVTLYFGLGMDASIDNSFLIQEAPNYTFIVKHTGDSIPDDAYFDFTEPVALEASGDTAYIGTAYVYESVKVPNLLLITNPASSETPKEYNVALPLPQRNYLYDIEIRIFDGPSTTFRGGIPFSAGAVHPLVRITTYDEKGVHKD